MKVILFTIGFIAAYSYGYTQEITRYKSGYKTNNADDAISISYRMGETKNQLLSASPNTNNDLTKGVAFNNGNSIRFQVSSAAPYFVKMYASEAQYQPAGVNNIQNERRDMRDYIYYQITGNETGGLALTENTYEGEILGSSEKTILTNCPATRDRNHSSADDKKGFSMRFKIKPGYSLPPGNYTTHLLFTATHE